MDEQTFFSHDGVRVTSARFVVDADTYAIRNITSTAAWTQPRKWVVAIICAVAGLAAIAKAPAIGLILLALGGLFFFFGRPVHFVRLHTSGGEVKAVKSYDVDYVQKVVAALNEAIVSQHRGA